MFSRLSYGIIDSVLGSTRSSQNRNRVLITLVLALQEGLQLSVFKQLALLLWVNLQARGSKHILIHVVLWHWFNCMSDIVFWPWNIGTYSWRLFVSTGSCLLEVFLGSFLSQIATICAELGWGIYLFVFNTLCRWSAFFALHVQQERAANWLLIFWLPSTKYIGSFTLHFLSLTCFCDARSCHFGIIVWWSHRTGVSPAILICILTCSHISSILVIIIWLPCVIHFYSIILFLSIIL